MGVESEIRLLESYLNDVQGAIRENNINILRLQCKRASLEKEELRINRNIEELKSWGCEVGDSGGKNRSKLVVGTSKKESAATKSYYNMIYDLQKDKLHGDNKVTANHQE